MGRSRSCRIPNLLHLRINVFAQTSTLDKVFPPSVSAFVRCCTSRAPDRLRIESSHEFFGGLSSRFLARFHVRTISLVMLVTFINGDTTEPYFCMFIVLCCALSFHKCHVITLCCKKVLFLNMKGGRLIMLVRISQKKKKKERKKENKEYQGKDLRETSARCALFQQQATTPPD